MLYELYKKNYFNLCDNLIIRLLHFSLIIIFKFFKLFFKNVRFTSIRCALVLCALRLGSRRPLRLSAPLTFTNTGFYWLKASPKGFSLESFLMLYQKKKKKKKKQLRVFYSMLCRESLGLCDT